MMILLNGQTLQPRNRFRAETMALNLEERNSTATITVGPEAPEIRINDWLKDEDGPGSGIIWRVKTVSDNVETRTRTISLEHIVQSLKDAVIFGEAGPAQIARNQNADRCTAREAVIYALGMQDLWRLGDLGENPSNPYSFNGDTVYAAIETVTGSLDGCQWEYDLTALPFTLHIRKASVGFDSEMRMRRNITTLRTQVDRTRMYTRLYPIGKNNLHITGDYVAQNDGVWGVVCKVETESSLDTEEKLRKWATDRVKKHSEPLVTVTATGLELSEATGEALDHIVVGRRCRIPLPDYGTAMTERVTKMSWADKIKEPEKVTVILANQVEDVASIVNQLAAASGRSGRAAAKKGEEDHAWFVDTTTHVAMVAEAVAGPGADQDWSRVSEVIVDGQGIHQRVTRTEGEIVAAWAAIEVLDDKIDMEVANAKSDMFSHVEQTASHIRSEVNSSKSTIFSTIMQTATNIYTQVGNAKSDMYSHVEQTASHIRSEVYASKSTIFSTIMQTATNIYTQVGNAKSDTYSKIEQTASSIRTEVNASKSTIFSTIMQTATNIYTQVGNAKSDTYSKIEQTASSIRSEVESDKSTIFSSIMQTATNIYTQVGNAKSDTYSKIEQTASSIRSEVDSAKSSLWSSIIQTSTGISQKVGKGEVISAINQTAESITIDADKINLEGYVTATNLSSQIASLSSVQVTTLNATNYIYASGFVIGSSTGGQGTNKYVSSAITDLQFVASGDSVKMQKKTFASDTWVDVGTFSRATSLSGAWSSGKLTVSANASNVSDLVQVIKGGTPSWDGRTVTIKIYAYTNEDQLIGETGREVQATYTLAKANITLTRQKKTSEPSTDGILSAITSNGWYQLDVTAAGVTKTWRVNVNV